MGVLRQSSISGKAAMAQDNQLLTAQLFQAAQCNLAADPASQAPQSKIPTLLNNVVTFCSFAIVSMVISTAAIWWIRREASPNASADVFLWLAGQNKTWVEYQEGQKSAGHPRMDENEYDWTQQLLNDAYSN